MRLELDICPVAYQLDLQRPVSDSIRHIARYQIKAALRESSDSRLARHERVHQIRKRCKKLRGLLRLVRPSLPVYKQENRFFRDAARKLSSLRDAQVMIECLDDLIGEEQVLDRAALEPLCEKLSQRRQQKSEHAIDLDAKLAEVGVQFEQALKRTASWQLSEEGFRAVRGGLELTYSRGQQALREVRSAPEADRFHELRKRVKYHWYHTRLLRPLWPLLIRREAKAGDELSDLLGDEHDLSVFRGMLLREPHLLAGVELQAELFACIDRRRESLRREAIVLSRRLFAEKPKHFVRRYQRYWKVIAGPRAAN